MACVVANGTLLEPNGYLQWYECVSQCFAEVDQSLNPLPLRADYFRLLEKYTALLSSNSPNFDNLTANLQCHGLVDVERTASPSMPHLLKQETDFVLWTCEEIFDTLHRSKAIGLDVDELEKARSQLAAELAGGKCLIYTMATFIGRKP